MAPADSSTHATPRKPHRRWLQFSVRTLFVLATICAGLSAWWGTEMRHLANGLAVIGRVELGQEREAIISKSVYYDVTRVVFCEIMENGRCVVPRHPIGHCSPEAKDFQFVVRFSKTRNTVGMFEYSSSYEAIVLVDFDTRESWPNDAVDLDRRESWLDHADDTGERLLQRVQDNHPDLKLVLRSHAIPHSGRKIR